VVVIDEWIVCRWRHESARRKAMTKVVLIAPCLAAATAAAQEAKVTPLMTQELAGIDGKEGTMPSSWCSL
jgi:hypothetical protein